MTEDQNSLENKIAALLDGQSPSVCMGIMEKIVAFIISYATKKQDHDLVLGIFFGHVKNLIELTHQIEKESEND